MKKCKTHPDYQGLRPPKAKCPDCWAIYNVGIGVDVVSSQLSDLQRSTGRKQKQLIERIKEVERERDAVKQIREVSSFAIPVLRSTGDSEAVAIVLASDWHYEERVKATDVNGLNAFDLGVADRRISQFFRAVVRLTKIFQKDIRINTMVLALLGDFISGDIHEELLEICQMPPVEAVIEVQSRIASGIQYILDNTRLNLIIPCVSGNHSRTTKKMRHATADGHSLEYFMYHALANHFKGNRRVKFLISQSYHIYLDVYDYVLRLHHGHDVKYQGGIGGLSIPLNKAIAQWNKGRHADIDCLGHWHTFRDFGNAMVNGSLIGHNAYAIAIKCDFERPKQTIFLLDRKRGKTLTSPIVFDD